MSLRCHLFAIEPKQSTRNLNDTFAFSATMKQNPGQLPVMRDDHDMLKLDWTDETPFSLDPAVLRAILDHAKPLGHNEEPDNLNLGFGFLYYGLVRALRPRHVLVIGSGYGFSVICLALGLKDNNKGKLSFVDPSYSMLKHGPFRTVGGTAQWDDVQKVRAHFRRFGVERLVTHYKLTSAEFFADYAARGLPEIDLAFIDGSHAYADVRHDFLSVLRHTHRNGYVLLHDSNIYVRELVRHAGVKRWLKVIAREQERFEVVDFPFSSGVALVRVLYDGPWEPVE
ncbi:MAG: class I SAM-dependent methyltransferase [Pseudomonadota bacterium]